MTVSNSFTYTPSATATPSATPSVTLSATFSVSPTRSRTFTASPSFTPQPGLHVDIRVYNGAGELVGVLYEDLGVYVKPVRMRTLVGSFSPDESGQGLLQLEGPGVVLGWDGRNAAAQFVESGSYMVVAVVTDSFGRTETWASPLTVIRADLDARLEAYNSAGELVYSRALSSTATGIGVSDSVILAGEAPAPIKVTYGRGAGDFVNWAGTNQAGQPLASGTYLLKISQRGPGGADRVYSQSVTVINVPSSVFERAVAVPGSLAKGQDTLTVVVEGAAPGTRARADVYNLAGEKVGKVDEAVLGWTLGFTPSPAPPGLSISWTAPGNLASGVYLIRVDATGPTGRHKQAYLKFVILR